LIIRLFSLLIICFQSNFLVVKRDCHADDAFVLSRVDDALVRDAHVMYLCSAEINGFVSNFDSMALVGQFSTIVNKLILKINQLVAYFRSKAADEISLCQRVFREQGLIALVVAVLDMPLTCNAFHVLNETDRELWNQLSEGLFALLVEVTQHNNENRAFFAEDRRVDHLINHLDDSEAVLSVRLCFHS
jgi:hypothetical protein